MTDRRNRGSEGDMGRAIGDATRALGWAVLAVLTVACAGAPGPGESSGHHLQGRYTGRLVVEGAPFDVTLDLITVDRGSLRGTYTVTAPLEIEGDVSGVVVDDLLRISLTYESASADDGQRCDGRIEGILTIASGGGAVDGPVTVTDCRDGLAGRLSFRRPSGVVSDRDTTERIHSGR